ncbi:Metallo-dependent phosphatase-like protein [Dunaliella salina]|uniref:Metallo-dependent phosphatase-like protein n=1 Tax=Dunaliella salina TaxID=3046 RepID=A0ABQ7GEV7_DUNSA|nr:Metallo-dependent phosphatase-like protein [Dunaliella salina]|eukprot:KAF5833127.1 Metallo-dependent phosphatase-like protein [Dunaliella salina]
MASSPSLCAQSSEQQGLLQPPTHNQQSNASRLRTAAGWIMVGGVCTLLGTLAAVAAAAHSTQNTPKTSTIKNTKSEPLACPFQHSTMEQHPDLTFFVVGDWGREDNEYQRNVGERMGMLADCYHPSFVVTTGDNFYEHGLRSLDDPLFSKCFTDVYSAEGLQVPWYAVLGNHDYADGSKNGILEEGEYSPRWQVTNGPGSLAAEGTNIASRDPRWNLRQGAWRMSFASGLLDIIFIDTTPLHDKYYGHEWTNAPGGVGSQNVTEQMETMQALLKTSTAHFKIVIGHHPCFSYGSHCNFNQTDGDCATMSSLLQPIFEQYQVDVYFAGHDHNLQFIDKSQEGNPDAANVYHVVSGAGSNVRTGAQDKIPAELLASGKAWMWESPGFAAVSIKDNSLSVDFWDVTQRSSVQSVNKQTARR